MSVVVFYLHRMKKRHRTNQRVQVKILEILVQTVTTPKPSFMTNPTLFWSCNIDSKVSITTVFEIHILIFDKGSYFE